MGPVESKLLEEIREHGCIHLALVDPEKFPGNLSSIIRNLEGNGTTAIMVGGSTVRSALQLDKAVKAIRDASSLPVILFPNGAAGISRFAHAIFFMSLLNSSNPQFIIGAQILGAPAVERFNLEPIPLGYLVVGESQSAVSTIGKAKKIPYSKADLAVAYALAAQYLGMRFVYLEAGSGAERSVDPRMVARISEKVDIPIIVGGGIKTPIQAERLVKAGASIIVTGTVLEQEGPARVKRILAAIKRA
jgi:phosphoglycerol geranylgeranyltransferase